jgi:hypothetical protein
VVDEVLLLPLLLLLLLRLRLDMATPDTEKAGFELSAAALDSTNLHDDVYTTGGRFGQNFQTVDGQNIQTLSINRIHLAPPHPQLSMLNEEREMTTGVWILLSRQTGRIFLKFNFERWGQGGER